jgi:hypothetical protein
MIIPDQPPRYHAYLLRCWEERGQNPLRPPSWRFSLEEPHTGERHGFADLAQLIAFLQGFAEGGQDGVDAAIS